MTCWAQKSAVLAENVALLTLIERRLKSIPMNSTSGLSLTCSSSAMDRKLHSIASSDSIPLLSRMVIIKTTSRTRLGDLTPMQVTPYEEVLQDHFIECRSLALDDGENQGDL